MSLMKVKIATLLSVGVLLLSTSNVYAVTDMPTGAIHPFEKKVNIENYRLDPEIERLELQKIQAAKANYIEKLSKFKPNSSIGVYATNNNVSVTFKRQANSYYCGPASALITIASKITTSQTQSTLANELGTTTSGTAWYLSNGNTYTQYPMYNTLKNHLGSMYSYVPSPTGVAGTNPLSNSDIKYRVTFTIDQGYPLVFLGTSTASGAAHLPNYPAQAVGHWLVANGYKSSGDVIVLTDPASALNSLFTNVPESYEISITTAQAFLSPRGLLW